MKNNNAFNQVIMMSQTPHQQTLTRVRIKEAFFQKLDLNLKDAGTILEAILDELVHGITRGEYLKIISFGTFLVHQKKARIGRNPKTKKEALISPRKSVSFRSSMALRRRVDPLGSS
jgi:integration host factor subunit alpha